MLSDEEKAIEELKNKEADYFMISNLTGKTLVNLIDKQSKEIEELKNADLTTVYLNGFYDGVKKFKDKIKAKIEELDYNDIANFERRCKQEVLQSLLEKE